MVFLTLLSLTLQHSTLIAGGSVADGTGSPARRADVRIVGDRIVAVGRLKPLAGEKVVRAEGHIVCPGFIDAHSHANGEIAQIPGAPTAIRQGITTSIVGQDGSSTFPLSNFMQELRAKPPALNFASFVGHGTVRAAVLGKDANREATSPEIAAMQDLVESEMKEGAEGLSSGLEYDPGFYSSTDELIQLGLVAGRYGGIYISHVRDEEDEAIKSFEELLTIGHDGHLPAQISHIKLASKPVWGKAPFVLKMMREARAHGQDVTADIYPYQFWQSSITVIIPTRDWGDRAQWVKGLDEIGGPGHVFLTSYSGNRKWQGKTITQIAKETKRDPIKVIQEIIHFCYQSPKRGSESVVVTAMTASDLDTFVKDPNIMFCTDGGLVPTHPRGAGSFPRVLSEFVRKRHVLKLEDAVRKMTSLPAHRFKLVNRGVIKPGSFADVVVFDPKRVEDKATLYKPALPPVGIDYVFVNGQEVVDKGNPTANRPGRFLKRGM